jgi:peptidoglycan/xylan/chitin deacetylase (PgdA/CDA1 family)
MRTVVMYHYVRNTEGTEFPGLYSRKLNQFDFQLGYLSSSFNVCALDSLHQSSGSTAVLTFDDGLKDHYRNVFPVLQKNNMRATFFVSSMPLIKPVVLDVHKIQLLLASQSHELLFELLASELGPLRIREYEESGAISNDPSRFDNRRTILFKRLLQRDLEEPLRSEILHKIFVHFLASDEKQISKELYMSLSELREMKAAGMVIGNHTLSHHWLGHIDIAEAKREILECENLLIQEGLMDHELKTIAYPYGNSTSQVETYLLDSSYQYAFTTVAEHWNPSQFAAMRIPRFDTNDLPFH